VTLIAVIKLDPVIFHDNHISLAGRAYHSL
jgi:hypothetical protein